mgnify:CR=1 FL=1
MSCRRYANLAFASKDKIKIMKAVNNFVWIIRDQEEAESKGIIIPGAGREKPHTGEIVSVGAVVRDGNIKGGKGKKAIFHKGIGFSIEYLGKEYLVLQDHEIIGVE